MKRSSAGQISFRAIGVHPKAIYQEPAEFLRLGFQMSGVILSQLDLADGIEARKHAGKLFVTVAIRSVEFITRRKRGLAITVLTLYSFE